MICFIFHNSVLTHSLYVYYIQCCCNFFYLHCLFQTWRQWVEGIELEKFLCLIPLPRRYNVHLPSPTHSIPLHYWLGHIYPTKALHFFVIIALSNFYLWYLSAYICLLSTYHCISCLCGRSSHLFLLIHSDVWGRLLFLLRMVITLKITLGCINFFWLKN